MKKYVHAQEFSVPLTYNYPKINLQIDHKMQSISSVCGIPLWQVLLIFIFSLSLLLALRCLYTAQKKQSLPSVYDIRKGSG